MNRIKDLRVRKGLKQAELAAMVNIKQNTISNWENEVTEIDRESLFKLSEIFNVSIDFLLCRESMLKDSDFADNLEKLVWRLEMSQEGLMFLDRPMDDETRDILISSLKHTIEMGTKFSRMGQLISEQEIYAVCQEVDG